MTQKVRMQAWIIKHHRESWCFLGVWRDFWWNFSGFRRQIQHPHTPAGKPPGARRLDGGPATLWWVFHGAAAWSQRKPGGPCCAGSAVGHRHWQLDYGTCDLVERLEGTGHLEIFSNMEMRIIDFEDVCILRRMKALPMLINWCCSWCSRNILVSIIAWQWLTWMT